MEGSGEVVVMPVVVGIGLIIWAAVALLTAHHRRVSARRLAALVELEWAVRSLRHRIRKG